VHLQPKEAQLLNIPHFPFLIGYFFKRAWPDDNIPFDLDAFCCYRIQEQHRCIIMHLEISPNVCEYPIRKLIDDLTELSHLEVKQIPFDFRPVSARELGEDLLSCLRVVIEENSTKFAYL
jgi:hypothetical protein